MRSEMDWIGLAFSFGLVAVLALWADCVGLGWFDAVRTGELGSTPKLFVRNQMSLGR